jgi:predicted ATPase
MKPVTISSQLRKLVLNGYKSIAECELELGSINILIGCNGAGKSNLISFFRMIQQMLDGNLQVFVSRHGGPDSILHFGRKTTETLRSELFFGNNGYQASFEATQDNRLMIAEEGFWWNVTGTKIIGRGHFESKATEGTGSGVDQFVLPAMKTWRVYHFHDTGDSAHVKQIHRIDDNSYLRSDGRNLAAFLYLLERTYPREFSQIVKTVR